MKEEKDKGSNVTPINGNSADGASAKGGQTFDGLVTAYGISPAVARGVRTMMQLPADGRCKEADFLAALKKFTGQTPR